MKLINDRNGKKSPSCFLQERVMVVVILIVCMACGVVWFAMVVLVVVVAIIGMGLDAGDLSSLGSAGADQSLILGTCPQTGQIHHTLLVGHCQLGVVLGQPMLFVHAGGLAHDVAWFWVWGGAYLAGLPLKGSPSTPPWSSGPLILIDSLTSCFNRKERDVVVVGGASVPIDNGRNNPKT
jgi:hypothetical protein